MLCVIESVSGVTFSAGFGCGDIDGWPINKPERGDRCGICCEQGLRGGRNDPQRHLAVRRRLFAAGNVSKWELEENSEGAMGRKEATQGGTRRRLLLLCVPFPVLPVWISCLCYQYRRLCRLRV
jgi:hypothetical protein